MGLMTCRNHGRSSAGRRATAPGRPPGAGEPLPPPMRDDSSVATPADHPGPGAPGQPGPPRPPGPPGSPPDPAALLRSRAYAGLLVVAAILGVPISAAAFGFLALVSYLQKELFIHLPHGLGYSTV